MNRWNAFVRELEQEKESNPELVTVIDEEFLQNPDSLLKSTPKQILDKLDITRVCCRKHFLCNVPMIDKI